MARGPARRTSGDAARRRPSGAAGASLADIAYARLRRDVFEFRLLPGDRFNEKELAQSLGMSRTPVREALYRLQRDGYLDVLFRAGWQVRPLDFAQLDELYDVRIVLELAAVRRLCEMPEPPALEELKRIWLVPAAEREADGLVVARRDEEFHHRLVAATGNREMARLHLEVTEKIRIVRRLDFTQKPRIEATYIEHGRILRAVLQRKLDQAQLLLRSHIEASKAEVRKITLHMLYEARRSNADR